MRSAVVDWGGVMKAYSAKRDFATVGVLDRLLLAAVECSDAAARSVENRLQNYDPVVFWKLPEQIRAEEEAAALALTAASLIPDPNPSPEVGPGSTSASSTKTSTYSSSKVSLSKKEQKKAAKSEKNDKKAGKTATPLQRTARWHVNLLQGTREAAVRHLSALESDNDNDKEEEEEEDGDGDVRDEGAKRVGGGNGSGGGGGGGGGDVSTAESATASASLAIADEPKNEKEAVTHFLVTQRSRQLQARSLGVAALLQVLA
jgi:hypothetical protein